MNNMKDDLSLEQYIEYWNGFRTSIFEKEVNYYTNSMSPSIEFSNEGRMALNF